MTRRTIQNKKERKKDDGYLSKTRFCLVCLLSPLHYSGQNGEIFRFNYTIKLGTPFLNVCSVGGLRINQKSRVSQDATRECCPRAHRRRRKIKTGMSGHRLERKKKNRRLHVRVCAKSNRKDWRCRLRKWRTLSAYLLTRARAPAQTIRPRLHKRQRWAAESILHGLCALASVCVYHPLGLLQQEKKEKKNSPHNHRNEVKSLVCLLLRRSCGGDGQRGWKLTDRRHTIVVWWWCSSRKIVVNLYCFLPFLSRCFPLNLDNVTSRPPYFKQQPFLFSSPLGELITTRVHIQRGLRPSSLLYNTVARHACGPSSYLSLY